VPTEAVAVFMAAYIGFLGGEDKCDVGFPKAFISCSCIGSTRGNCKFQKSSPTDRKK